MKEKIEKTVELEENVNGIRLDNFISSLFPLISRSYLQKEVVSAEKVRVNGLVKSKKGQILVSGDQVEIEPFQDPGERKIKPKDRKDVKVVFENKDYVVLHKPFGIPTHPNSYDDEDCLSNVFAARFPESIDVGEDPLRPGVVHRLDTYTSGCLVFAKTQEAHKVFRQKFDDRKMYKLYLALVIGKTKKKGIIEYQLAHHPQNARKMVAITHDNISHRSQPREALTAFHRLDQNEDYSLLLVKTFTGRMHQVRIHLASIGFPLVGDKLYQTRQIQHKDIKGQKHHSLHAHHLGFYENEEERAFSTAIPEYFLDKLKKAKLTFKAPEVNHLFLSIQEFLDSPPFADLSDESQD